MRVIKDPRALEEYSKDAGILTLKPVAVCFASTSEEISEVLAEARKMGIPVTPRGSGTSIPSQAVGRGYILTFDGKETKVGNGRAEVSPAVVKDDMDQIVDSTGMWMPVNPASYRSCSVGGMVANNSSGARTYKYHSTIDYVAELDVVLPEEGLRTLRPIPLEEARADGGSTGKVARLLLENQGAITRETPKVTKNSSGYRIERVVHDGIFDLPKLFVGSEGTVGVVTRIAFSLVDKPRERVLLIMECDLAELDVVVSALRVHHPAAVELVDKALFRLAGREKRIAPFSRTESPYLVFCEFDGDANQVQRKVAEVAEDPGLAGRDPLLVSDRERLETAWDVRSEALLVAGEVRREGRVPVPGVEDVVVPPQGLGRLVKYMTAMFEDRGLEYVSYGHAGDANLHMRPLLDLSKGSQRRALEEMMEACFEEVWKMGGSMTGEHGDGMLRAPFVGRQYKECYHVMKAVKEVYDPKGLLNPGVKVV